MDNRVMRKKLCVASLLATLALGMPSYAAVSENSVYKSDINRYFKTVESAISDTEINTAIAAIAVSDLPANPTLIMFDTDLKNSVGDTITIENPASSTVKIYGINIMEDVEGGKTTVRLFDGPHIPLIDLNDYIHYTNNSKYIIKEIAPGELEYQKYSISGSINSAVADTEVNRVFSGTANTLVQEDLGTMGGTELTIIGNGYDIDGNGHQGIKLTHGQSLNLNNLGSLSDDGSVDNSVHGFTKPNNAFVNNNGGSVKVENSVFSNNEINSSDAVDGGIFYNESGNLVIKNSKFINNTINSASASSRGGALFFKNGNVFIKDSIFKSNSTNSDSTGSNGGAIFNTANLTISGTLFENNSANSVSFGAWGGAINNGGILNISESTFKNNTLTSNQYGNGSAINNAGTLNLSASTFENNSNNASVSHGGAIFNNGNANIYGTAFVKNTSTKEGGAIYNETLTSNIYGSVFTQNTAVTGGAILNRTGNLNVYSSQFTGNNASDLGGAISSREIGNVTSVFDSSFIGNTAQSNGGAIDIYHGVLNISGSYFENNNSDNVGGAISVGDAQTKIINSIFKNNTSTVSGGAIHTNSILSIIADNGITEFSGNTDSAGSNAVYSGNDIFFNASNNSSLIINDKIKTSDISHNININSSGVKLLDGMTDAGTDGNIKFNDSITNATVNLNGGSLVLGDYENNPTDSNGYFNNVNLNLNNGTFNSANGVSDTFNIVNLTAQNTSNLFLDADLKNNAYDKFNISGNATGILNVGALNITGDFTVLPVDGGKSVLEIFDSSKSATLAVNGNTYTNDYKYYISSSATNGALDLRQYDITDTIIRSLNTSESFKRFDFDSNIETYKSLDFSSPVTVIIDGHGFDLKGNSQYAVNTRALSGNNIIISNIGYMNPDGTILNSAHGFGGVYGSFATSRGYMQINNSVFTDNNVTIDGGVFWAGGKTDIYDSHFKNNSALHYGGAIAQTGDLNVFGSTFDSNTAVRGGAIHNETAKLTIFDSVFTSNNANLGGAINTAPSAHSKTTVFNSLFQGNRANAVTNADGTVASGNGGAVANAANAMLKVDSSVFKSNNANNGGAIFNTGYLIVTDSSFGGPSNSEGNTAVYGGAVYHGGTGAKAIIDGSTFSHNSVSGLGGAIYAESDITITGSAFDSNIASNGGGAIYNNIKTMKIYDSVFTNNSTSNVGGAIYNISTGVLNVVDSSFTDNTAQIYGGAINNSGTAYVSGSHFENNFATTTGSENGGGSIFNTGKLYVSGSTFVADPANTVNKTQFGGAIWTMSDASSYLNIKNSEFSGHRVSVNGGAVYSNHGRTDIFNSIFTDNSAQGGGGAILQGGTWLNIYDTDFISNSAQDQGGALHITNVETYISGAQFKGNTAANYGGAIYADSSNVFITDSIFGGANASDGNSGGSGGVIYSTSSTVALKNSLFQNNIASLGSTSAIYNTGGGHFNIYNSVFKDQSGPSYGGVITNVGAGVMTIFGSTFENNTASSGGGAIMNDDTNTSLIVSKSVFKNNTGGADAGGAIYSGSGNVSAPTTLTVKSSTFENNSSTSGGAIYNGRALSIFDTTFISNHADVAIGGAFRSEGNTEVFYSTFDSNKAKTIGGAVYVSNGININGSSFTDNSAETLGGALYKNVGTAEIRDSVFTNNTALKGGAVYNSNYSMDIFYSDFNGNKAAIASDNEGGGAIYNYSGTVNVTGGTFSDNTAQKYGGAIDNRATANIYNSSFTNNIALGNDGGAIMNFGTINIENSYFAENSGNYGGAFRSYGPGATAVITSSTFENNTTRASGGSRGGAIELDTNATVTVNSSIFKNNIVTGTGGNGGAIYNTGARLTVNNSYFSANTATTNGSAIYNNSVAVINNSTFVDNSASLSGTIYNTSNGNLTITGSYFNNNSSSNIGGVIFNSGGNVSISTSVFENNMSVNMNSGVIRNDGGAVRITNSYFADNKSTDINNTGSGVIEVRAGSITSITNSIFKNNSSPKYNYSGVSVIYGDVSLIGDKGSSYVTGNTGNSASGAFLIEGSGILNFNAGNGGIVRIDDRISNNGGIININKSGIKGFDGTTDAPANGMVILNHNIESGNTINLYNGILSMGSWEKKATVSGTMNYYGGILNFANGKNENNQTFSVNRSSDVNVMYDVKGTGGNDTLKMGSGSGRWVVRGLNIINDSAGSSFQISGNDRSGMSYAFTNDYKYSMANPSGTSTIFTKNSGGGFANAAADQGAYKSFSLTKDYNASHNGIYAGANGSMFTIFGNKHSLSGNTNLNTQNNQTINIFGVGEYDRTTGTVKSAWSDVITTNAAGVVEAWTNVSNVTVNVSDSVFSNNATANGAVFALANVNKLSVNNGVFVNNRATTSYGGVLEQAQSSSAVFLDSIFKNNSAATYGGAIGNITTGSFLSVTSSEFIGNTAVQNGGAISYMSTAMITDSTFKGNIAAKNGGTYEGGAIYNSGTMTIQKSVFGGTDAADKNTAYSGGAISNSEKATMNIYNTDFVGNSSSYHGGAIINHGNMNIYNSNFEKNTAITHAGSIMAISTGASSVTTNIYNSIFVNNSAGVGGVFHSSYGMLSIYNSVFNNNRATTGSGGVGTFSSGVKIFDSRFNENIAKSGGVLDGSNTSAEIHNSIFKGNKANGVSNDDGGGAIRSASSLTITGSTFGGYGANDYNNAVRGGAIFTTAGTTNISNSAFIANTANEGGAIFAKGTMTIDSSEFINNISRVLYGGAIVNDSTMTINKSTFSGNTHTGTFDTALGGGAIFNVETVTVSNSDFVKNSSVYKGGAIYNMGTATINHSTFGSVDAADKNSAADGGAIYNTGIMEINYSKFLHNSAANSGGAIYSMGGKLTINNSVFDSNSAGDSGGVLVFANAAQITINSSEFTNNTSLSAPLYFSYNTGSKLTINDSIFKNNSATLYHGGVIDSGGEIIVNNSYFEGNSAATTGGAIANYDTDVDTLTDTGSTYKNNTASSGGAIYSNGALTILNDKFLGNKAISGDGGAIYIGMNTAVITSSIFGGTGSGEGNSATSNGGAIFINSGTVTVSKSKFLNNSAGNAGGAIYNKGTLTITDSIFNENTAQNGSGAIENREGTVTVKNSTFDSNSVTSSMHGGAIGGRGTIVIEDSRFTNNRTSINSTGDNFAGAIDLNYGSLTINNSTFEKNYADNEGSGNAGGGVLSGNGYFRINNSVFKDNRAKTFGGAFYHDSGDDAIITGSSFIANHSGQGGAIYSNSSMTINDGIFTNNYSNGHGGAIYNASGTMTVNNSVFKGNTTGYDGTTVGRGGAIENFGTLIVSNSIFGGPTNAERNSASGDGGAIASSGTYEITDSVFTNNYSAYSGGAVSGAGVINSSVFAKNKAQNGGAIIASTTLIVNNSTFTENIAAGQGQGGAIANFGGTVNISDSSFRKNNGVLGAAIWNNAVMIVSDSLFDSNTASANGGAITNTANGNLTVINSVFKNNIATSTGALYNQGTANIIADNGITEFTGNKYGTESRAISNLGVLNLNAGNNGKIIFNDVVAQNADSIININNTGIKLADGATDAPTDGDIYLNNYLYSGTVNVYNGSLSLSDEKYLTAGDAANLNLSGGTLNLINNKIGTAHVRDFSSLSGSRLNIDADLTAGAGDYGQSDSITVHGTLGAGSTIALNAVNILKDGDAQHLTIFNNAVSPEITTTSTYTNGGYKYTFTQNADIAGVVDVVKGEAQPSTSLSTAGFIAAIKDTSANRAFSATGDVDVYEALPAMGGTTLTIFGNQHNINGNGNTRFDVRDGQILNVYNVGSMNAEGTVKTSWNGFASGIGGALLVAGGGKANIYNSVFYNNKSTSGSSGVIKIENNSTVNLYDSTFISNYSGGSGVAMLQNNSALNAVNTKFISNKSGVFDVDNSTINIINSLFDKNSSNTNYQAGAVKIGNNSFGNFYNTKFSSNTAITNGGAIYAEGTVFISGSTFESNKAGASGAIHVVSGADVTITDSVFSNNSAGSGGAIMNGGNLTVKNGEFKNNSATGDSGAIRNMGSGILNLIAETGKKMSVSGNHSELFGGVIDNDSGASAHIIAQKGSQIIFENNYGSQTDGLGGAIFNAGDTGTNMHIFGDTGSIITFKGNKAKDGGAIYNQHGIMDIKADSLVFESNSADRGGAILHDTNEMTVFGNNVKFINNTAKTSGGAIANLLGGTFNLMTENGVIEFKGNTVNGVSNAVYNEGTLNLNAGRFGQIVFNDRIISNNIVNEININSTGTVEINGTPVNKTTGGTVIFNEKVENSTINLYDGTLKIGKESYLSGTIADNTINNLNISGGLLDLVNGKIGNAVLNDFTAGTGSKLNFDADLTAGSNGFGNSDSITVLGAVSGEININAVNVIKDGNAEHLTLFTDEKSPLLNALRTYTNNAVYTFSPSSTAGVIDITSQISASAGLPEAVKDTITTRAFSATAEVNLDTDLGAMGGTNSTLTIFGNKHDFNGNGHKGIIVNAGQTLNIYDIGSLNDDGTVKTSANGFVPSAGSGGFANVQGGKVNVSNSVFADITSADNAVFIVDNAEFNISGSTLMNNTADGGAGVIGASGSSTVNIIDSLFKLNRALGTDGGALFLENAARAKIEQTYFHNNSANSRGGAVYQTDSAELQITNSEFKENDAQDGGAIYNLEGTSNIKDSLFESNIASNTGGAVYNGGTLTVDNTAFNKNKVSAGGIEHGGGAIYNKGGAVTVTGSAFNENSAFQYGGAVYNTGTGASMDISESVFTANKITSTNDEERAGGAIYNTAGMTITDSVFGGSTVDASNVNTDANSAHTGGAIYNTGSLTIKASEGKLTKFISNTAGYNGGAIFSSGFLDLSDVLFDSNSAVVAGALVLGTGSDVKIKDTEFKSNTSKNGGGAVYASGSKVDITGTSFTANKVTESAGSGIGFGGAIYNDAGSDMTVTSSTFGTGTSEGANTAANSGGAIFNKALIIVNDSVFDKNTAINSGGAITNEVAANINTSTFKNNTSHIGGAVYNYGTMTVADSTFENNTANSDGGAIANDGILDISAAVGKTTTFTGNKANGISNDIYNFAAGTVNFKGEGEIIVTGGISGEGTLNKTETGTLKLWGINENFTGTTIISGGKILYNKAAAADSYLGGITKVNTNGILEFDVAQNNEAVINGNIQSLNPDAKTGTFIKTGEGTVKLMGDNSLFKGNAVVSDGKMLYVQAVDSDRFFGGVTTINTDKVLEFNMNGADGTLAGQIAGNGLFNKTGANTLTVSSDNTAFSGLTTVKEGTLRFLISGANDKYFTGDTLIDRGAIFEADTAVEGTLDTVLKGTGSFVKSGNDKLNLAGDSSAFIGSVDINAGTLAFSTGADKKFFGSDSVNITNAALDYRFNESGTFDKDINLKGSANFNIDAANSAGVTISSGFNTLNRSNIVNLTNGTFIFSSAMDSFSGADNKFSFKDTTFKVIDTLASFGSSSLNADFENTHINLTNGKTGTLNFDNLNLIGSNNNLSVDIDLKNNADQYLPGVDPSADKIIANTGSGTLTLYSVKIVVDGRWANKEIQLVDAGNITINNFNKYTEYTSGGYEYDISKSAADGGSIVVSTTDYNIANTLKKAHKISGERGFTVGASDDGSAENTYFVLSNLDSMGTGKFDVKGISKNSSTITGNNLWTLFDVDSSDSQARTLNIKDVKIANAVINTVSGRTDGAALNIKGADSTVNLTNTIFDNNISRNGGAISNFGGTLSASDTQFINNKANTDSPVDAAKGGAVYAHSGTSSFEGVTFSSNSAVSDNSDAFGGAIYNETGSTLNITDSTFSSNTVTAALGAKGGAIYNKGILNIISTLDKNTVFGSNSTNGVFNDIYNDGGTLTFKGKGITYINSGISGTGSIKKEETGELILHGQNSDFGGTVEINNGRIVFDKQNANDTYLGGTTTINKDDTKDGILEYNLTVSHNFTGENKILGSGTFLKSGSADLNVSGVNNLFKGTVKIENGNLNYNQTSGGKYFGGATDLLTGTILNFTNADTDTINGLKGSGEFNKNGLGTVLLKGDSSAFDSEFAKANINEGSLTFIKAAADDKFMGATVNIASAADLTFDLALDEAVGGNIKGSGTITKKGAADLILTKDNSAYNGVVTIQDGRIIFNVEDEGDVYFGGKTVINAGKELVYNLSIYEYFTGTDSITGEGSFVKTISPASSGDSVLHVSGKNSAFTGTVKIEDGAISYEQSEGGTYFGGLTEISDGAQLDFTNTSDDTINGLKTTGAVQSGALNKYGTGTAILKGDNSAFNGIASVNQGKLSFNKAFGSDKFVNGEVLVKNGAELNFDMDADGQTSGKISGEADGTVSKTGTGTLILGGDNKDFLGTAKIEEGVLDYQQTDSSSYFGGSTQIGNGAVLKFTNNNKAENIKNINGSGSFIKEGSETLVLKGNNAGYTGSVSINGGTLKFNDRDDIFFSSDSINISGTDNTQRAALDYTANGNSVLDNTINLNGNADLIISGLGAPDGTGKNKVNILEAANTSSSGNNASFNNADFVFNNSFENFGKNGTDNKISFDNSTLQLGSSTLNFGNSALNAELKNSVIDLANDKINHLTFDNLTIGSDVKMNIDLDLKNNPDQTSHIADPEADMIKYNSGSGTLKIDSIAISVNGQWRDAEVRIMDGSGIIIDEFDPMTAATSSEYEYAVQKSNVAGHENTHIQISTTDYISDPTSEDYSLKRMHIGVAPDGHTIGENRSFTVDEDTPIYKVLSNLGEMGKGKLDIFGKTDTQGNPERTISGNGLWSLFNMDSTDSDSRTLNIKGVIISDASTENDTRKNGSALNIIGADSDASIRFSSFENNKSEENGGAVYNDGGKLTVENSSFSKNNAGLNGGAINNADGVANISGTNFSENTAQSGGAIHNDSTLILQNVNFDKNQALAGSGGAVVNTDTTTITNANFTNNTSSANGGSVYNTGSFTVNNAVFIDNSADGNGGAIYNSDSLKLYDTSFSGNSSGGKGGAIYNTGDLEINASADKTISFADNTANGTKNDIWTSNGLTVKGEGNVNILSGIAGSGTLNKQDSGVLNLSGKNEGFSGNALINGGRLVFHKETADDTYIGGTTTVNSGAELVYNLKADDTVSGNINGDGTFIKAGSAVLNVTGDNSAFSGKTDIQSGILRYTQSAGSSYFSGTTSVQNGAVFEFVNSDTDSVKDISGSGIFKKLGEGVLNLAGKNADFKGSALIEEGTLDYRQTADSSYFGGGTSIAENAHLKFTTDNDGSTNIEKASNLSGKGTFTKDGSGNLKLGGSNAEFSGHAVIENGRLTFEKTLNADSFLKGKTTINENGELEFSLYRDQVLESEINGTGKIIKAGDSALVLNNDHTAFKGDFELKEGAVKIGKEAKFFDVNNFTMYEKTLFDLRNSSTSVIDIGNLILNGGSAHLGLDVDLRNKTGDFITADSVSGSGNLLIKHLNIYSDGFLPNTLISVVDTKGGLSQKVTLDESLKTALGPIYRYQVSYNQATGQLNFIGGEMPVDAAFNPAVLAAPVAAQVGGYLAQLNTYDDAFANMDMLMLLPRAEREAMRLRNKYAAADSNLAFTPTMIPEQDKGGWFRPFSSFESVPLSKGPKVSNVAYGSLMGVDSEIKDLGHGFEGVFSAYAGYNGSQQRYQGVSISQNGGVLGGTVVAYRGNFFTGLTANVGANQALASTMYGSDDFTMLMAGIASKTGYNWELNNGKFVVQPNLMMSYTFVNTFDFTNAAGVKISSDPLNAIQVAPGVKFIGNLKNGWQPYASVSVVMNFMDKAKFHANDVTLPEMAVKPFVLYGVGVQKRWGERFTGFFQTMLRSGGRNGIGFQLGFRWTI